MAAIILKERDDLDACKNLVITALISASIGCESNRVLEQQIYRRKVIGKRISSADNLIIPALVSVCPVGGPGLASGSV
jgi:hypothetical protein